MELGATPISLCQNKNEFMLDYYFNLIYLLCVSLLEEFCFFSEQLY